jgi:hypothetical protein
MDHHIDGLHSLSGEISDYASKAHQAIDTAQEVSKEVAASGGSIKDKVKTGAVIARKGLRTTAAVANATAAPASLLGMATENPYLIGYAAMAPVVAEAAELGAYGLGQSTKTL